MDVSERQRKTRDGCRVAILVENDSYPEDVRVRNEAQSLAAAGYRVTVVAPRGPKQRRHERLEGIEVKRFWLPRAGQNIPGLLYEYLVAHLQLARLTLGLVASGTRIIHLSNPPDTLSPLLVIARLLGRRAVFDNHDLFPELFELRYGKGIVARVLRLFQMVAFRSADIVLTTNESQRDLVLSRVKRDPATVLVVRNGPRAQELTEPSLGNRRAAEPAAPLQLLFLGALEPQDGVVTLAEVIELLTNKFDVPCRLTVVGEGSSRSALSDEARRRGVAEFISFTGRVAHEEVSDWLCRADICVDPAPCNDLNHASTMIKIAEYMAAGKPIVAFDLRETRRTAGKAALYAACGDTEHFAATIAEIAHRPELARSMTNQAQARLPDLLWERSAEVLLEGYARLGVTPSDS